MDLKRLIPEHFLTSQRVIDFLDSLQSLLNDTEQKIDALKDVIDPREIERDFLHKLIELIGGHDIPSMPENKYRQFIRIACEMWWNRSSDNFYKVAEYLLGISLPFTDLDQYSMKLSDGLPIGEGYLENNYFRQGALKLEVSTTDYELIKDMIGLYSIAGFYVYMVITGLMYGTDIKEFASQKDSVPLSQYNLVEKVFQYGRFDIYQKEQAIELVTSYISQYFRQPYVTLEKIDSNEQTGRYDRWSTLSKHFSENKDTLQSQALSSLEEFGDIVQRAPYIVINEEVFILS